MIVKKFLRTNLKKTIDSLGGISDTVGSFLIF